MKNWYLHTTALSSPEGADSGAAGTAGSSADSTPPAGGGNEGTDIRALLDFDPFEPAPAAGQEGEEKKSSTPAPAGKETKKVGDDQLPPDDPASAPPKPDPVSQQLQEVANLLRQQTEANARPKPEASTPAPKGPKFNLAIPDSISKALLASEEPTERAAALTEFANGLSNLIYDETMREVRGYLTEIVRRIPEISRNQMTELTTQQEMQKDFWDSVAGPNVPEANRLPKTAEMGQFVAFTAQNLAKEMMEKGQRPAWTPEFRNEIVQRVYRALGKQLPGQQQQQRPNGNGGTPPRGPKPASFASGTGQRGGDQTQFKTDLEKEIAETFDF